MEREGQGGEELTAPETPAEPPLVSRGPVREGALSVPKNRPWTMEWEGSEPCEHSICNTTLTFLWCPYI